MSQIKPIETVYMSETEQSRINWLEQEIKNHKARIQSYQQLHMAMHERIRQLAHENAALRRQLAALAENGQAELVIVDECHQERRLAEAEKEQQA